MPVRAILFDKDGTLFDFQRTWAPWVAVVIDRLAQGDEQLADQLARAWHFDRAKLRIGRDSIIISGEVEQVARQIHPLVPGYGPDALLALLDETGAQAEGVPVLPLAGFLQGLSDSGLRLGVATNDTESTARAQLHRAGIEHRFDFIAGYDSGHGGKPAPGMCLAFADHLDLDPAQIVMVGDSRHDLCAGRAAGMRCVGVLTGLADESDLAPYADVVLSDIGELPRWLGQVLPPRSIVIS